MAQWINLNQNNRSMLTHQHSVLGEKTGPILVLLVGCMAGREGGRAGRRYVGRPAEKMRVAFKFLKFPTG